MAVSKETIEAIIDHLCDELDRGNHFFQIANALHKAHEKNQLHNAPYFFAGAYDACLRESILSLAKLTVLDKESITLSYLLDAAVQTPKMFQSITHDELKTAIAEHKKQLEDYDH